MPEISRFLGIVIAMFYNDHNPPHFHAKYGDFRAAIAIHTGEIIEVACHPGFWVWFRNGANIIRMNLTMIGI